MKRQIIAVSLMAVMLLSGCGDKESYFDKAQTALESGKYEDALEDYSRAIMEDEELALSYRGAGICCFMMADYDKAEDYFTRALKESKGVVGDEEMDLSYYLAETYVCKGNNDAALEVYNSILDFDSSQTDARVYRGVIYVNQGEIDKAKKDFSKAVENGNSSISLYYHIYEALSGCGDEEAEKYLQKGLECKEDGMEDLYMKGCLYKAANNTQSALEYLDKSKQAGYGKSSFVIGQIYEEQGDLASAIANYDDFIKVSNVSASEYVQIINCRIKAGDIEQAKADCENAVANADTAHVQYMRFEQIAALEKMGEFGEAKEKMVQYLADYPDDERARRESEFLQTR